MMRDRGGKPRGSKPETYGLETTASPRLKTENKKPRRWMKEKEHQLLSNKNLTTWGVASLQTQAMCCTSGGLNSLLLYKLLLVPLISLFN